MIEPLDATLVVNFDEHYVDTPRTLKSGMCQQIMPSCTDDAALFGSRDRLFRRNHGAGSTSANLGEDQLALVVGNQVDLPVSAVVVPGYNAVPQLCEMVCRQPLSGNAPVARR
jgi:hypothetical protein